MFCARPIRVGVNLVPCGKCPACLANKRQEWVFRLRCEYYACNFGLFVTLTYDDEHLPPEGVKREDLQLFLKRLRKRLGNRSFRYFITTEYGDNTHRAHAHGLFFFNSSVILNDSLYNNISEAWSNGFVSFGDIEEGSIVYCTKYCLKKTAVPPGKNQPFQLMSRRPGIGYTHIEEFGEYYQQNMQFGVSYLPGVSSRMPRYFRDKIKPIALDLEHTKRLQLDLKHEAEKRTEYNIMQKFEAYKRRFGHNKTYDDFSEFMIRGQERKNDLIIKHTKKQIL